ncbi:MAG: FAD-dependent oxidoreductase [Alphaproteobacteria bacterium]|nr:FAD-dependent oxidoreductase [Alphaproteobacteria bacterium]
MGLDPKKVAVIGAGIVGLNTAYKSAREGMDVTIFEKQEFPPANASSIAGGMLAPFSEIEVMPLNFVQAGLKGISFWKDNLGQEQDKCMQNTGSLFIAHPEDKHMLERFAYHMPDASDEWEWVEGEALAKIEPMVAGRFNRGLYIPAEANLHPLIAMEILAKKLKDMGANIIQKEADPVELEKDFDWVVDCRGWVDGVDKDLRGIKGEIILLENKEFKLSRPVRMMHPRYPLYIIPRPNNVFAVGASAIENADEDDGLVFLRSAMELMSAAYSLHPSFGDAKVLDMSSAIRPSYIDNLPRINITQGQGYDEGEGGYIRCNGTFRHGYLLSPVMANCVSHYIATGEENEDFALFSGQYNFHVASEEAA